MYCKNCGNEINPGAAVCLNCGAAKDSGSKFCAHCGSDLNEGAKVCIKCGYSIKMSPEKTANDTDIHCTNCGALMKSLQEICLSCGAKNGTGKKFCRSCGAEVNENAVVCLSCGNQIKAAANVNMPDMSAVKNGISNIGSGIKNLNTDAITENKFSHFFGLIGSAAIILCFLLPCFTMSAEVLGIKKAESYNGFQAAFSAGNSAITSPDIALILTLLVCIFQIVSQFVKPLEKIKPFSDIIAGGGSLLFLIISIFVESGRGDAYKGVVTVYPTVGFYIALIFALALTAWGILTIIKRN